MQKDKLTLNIYDGDYGLASLDIDCLQTILYATIAGAPVKVNYVNNLKNCLLRTAPSLQHGSITLRTFDDIVLYLRTLNFNIDHELSAKQCSETFAVVSLVSSELRPVIDFVYWIDQRNVDEFTNVWHMKALPIPFNYAYNRRSRKRAHTFIETIYPHDNDMEIVKEFISTKATQCLGALSVRLGSGDYFYGSKPTTLDVVVYSHVAPLLKLPFPSNQISSLLAMWPNLAQFVKRIDAKYFPNLSPEPKYIKKVDTSKTNNDDEVSYLAMFIFTLRDRKSVV